jgi:beta-galactosidase
VAELSATKAIAPFTEAVFAVESDPIRNPALWSVDSPQLYSVHVSLKEAVREIDREETSFGLRWFEFRANEGFFLNGKHVELFGVNRHQDYAGLANAVPLRLQVHDAELIKEMGGNFVRASHYPQHPAFLDACDRLGILVYEEIASWQYIGGERFARNAEAMLREMIERDRNHPSVILWGLFNEGRSRELFERLNHIAHQADPTRPTIYADNNPDQGKALGTISIPDVLGINYRTEEIDGVRALVGDRKLLCSEHTNFDRCMRGDPELETAQIERLKHNLDILENRPYLAGAALWSMHDYGTDYEPVWPEQHSGVLDSVRLPKEAFFYLKSRWSREPVVHICNHWTWPGQEGKRRVVTVVSNCDSVELYLGGRSLGVRKNENPARWEVTYEPGVLRAIGRRGGRTVEHELQTAGAPEKLRMECSTVRIKADGADAAELTVTAVDDKGAAVPVSGTIVRFAVRGPGFVRGIGGNSSVQLHAGTGRIVVQSDTVPGEIAVTASAGGLGQAVAILKSE